MDFVHNPSIPYLGPLPSSLQPGSLITIQGTVHPNASCFAVNLQVGPNTRPRDDIALHLSPVFVAPPRLVRNSVIQQQWGPEENYGSHFPFVAGQGFELIILAEQNQFKIAVNGQHVTEFEYRLPLHTISFISIDGEVNISLIKFEISPQAPVSSGGSVGMPALPIGFIDPDIKGAPTIPEFNPSPYPVGGIPVSQAYGPPSPSNPYGPPSPSNPYGPPSPSNPYGPPPSSVPYGPSGGGGYPPQQGNYPQTGPPYGGSSGYPTQSTGPQGAYPTGPQGYSQGQSVVYPGQSQQSSGGGMSTGQKAAGLGALAAGLGAAVMGKKAGTGGMGGGPASLMTGGLGSMFGGGGKPGHKSGGSKFPLGPALMGGATAAAGAYMLSKSPIGKVLKPKKMKKMYKHKHGFHGFRGSSSSSSSSSEEE